jgi:hypothetical protein
MTSFLERILSLKPDSLAGADKLFLRFAAQYGNWVILGLFVALAALAVLTVVSYLREGDNPRRAKLTLAGIRMLVILVIFTLLWQPCLTVSRKQTLYSTVVVLMDDSRSMKLQDRYAGEPARSALAKKLGLSGEDLKNLSRTDLVKRLLAGQDGPLAQLAKDHPLVIQRFPNTSGSEKYATEVARIMEQDGAPARQEANQVAQRIAQTLDDLKNEGNETNLGAALRSVVNEVQGQRLAGVVLISDGQVTGGGEVRSRLSAAMAYVRQHGVKVYTIGVGDPEPPRNVAVLSLQAPREVRQGSDVEMTAYIANRRCAGQTAELELARRPADSAADAPWEKVDMTTPANVELTGKDDDQTYTQEIPVRFDSAKDVGDFIYQLTLKPLENEFSAADNSATLPLRISSEKIKVLLVSGDAGWEFQYLRNLLLRSPDHYAVSVWQQDAEEGFNQEASSQDMKLAQLPRAENDLYKYEVVILYDPAPYDAKKCLLGIDTAFTKLLDKFVGDHHGGLLFIASNKYSDQNLTSPQESLADLVAMLPVVLAPQTRNLAERIATGEPVAWQVLPTAIGLEHPALRLSANPQENFNLWRQLPGVFWAHAVQRIKPLANALCVSADPTLRSSDNQPLPLIAVQYYGRGRSLYLGFDESWRWRYLYDGALYRKFWTNMVDFLAAGNLEKKRIVITTGADKVTIGEEVRIHVEAYDKNYRPFTQDKIEVQLVDASGVLKSLPVTLGRVSRKVKVEGSGELKEAVEGTYEGVCRLSNEGSFVLTYTDPEYKDDVAAKALKVVLPEDELKHPEADPATLQIIGSGENFLNVEQADKLAQMIAPDKKVVYNESSFNLWDAPLVIILVVTLLAVEWILRKRYNMA